jgi:hypothetical protein
MCKQLISYVQATYFVCASNLLGMVKSHGYAMTVYFHNEYDPILHTKWINELINCLITDKIIIYLLIYVK